MTITIGDMLDKIAVDLQEDDRTFPSGLWTASEIIGYINYACGYFLNDTGIIVVDNSISTTAGTRLYDRPVNGSDILRISFDGKRLVRVSLFDLTAINYKWRETSGIPKKYHEDGLSIDQFELDKVPTRTGTIRVFSDYLSPQLSSELDIFPMQDCWEQYIRWEAISFSLQKDGETQDLERADWAHKKYLFGVNLAKRITQGNNG